MSLKKTEVATLNEVKAFLDSNVSEKKIPLTTLTKMYGLNKDKLTNGFKQLFGETTIHYQIHIRMKKAADLLRSSDKLVKEVAYEVGYGQAHKFIPEFKKIFGLTPGEYRIRYTQAYAS